MAVGGGVRVASSVEVWGRRGRSGSKAASTVRCSYVGEAGPAAPGGLAEEHYRTLRLRPGATRGEVKKAFRRLALMVRSSSPLPATHTCLRFYRGNKPGSLISFSPPPALWTCRSPNLTGCFPPFRPAPTLQYHPDVCKESGDRDCGVQFQRINVAYQMVMSNMREAEERLEYWRLKYGLNDQDLDRYRNYLNDDDDWFDM
ncbi:unnamed protein product [Urochloa decumbens]|uniref:J domain-containing protein n=1 Tax=Urochloa decumbens TaxID=240449 RepID=A0ABC9DLL1_9POAL